MDVNTLDQIKNQRTKLTWMRYTLAHHDSEPIVLCARVAIMILPDAVRAPAGVEHGLQSSLFPAVFEVSGHGYFRQLTASPFEI